MPCRAQEIRLDPGAPSTQAGGVRVVLDTDTATVDAGKPGWVELRFHVLPGYHINSHTPGDETLIPTTLRAVSSPELHLLRTEFPAGVPYHLAIGAGQTLSTYQGAFAVRLQVEAPAKGELNLLGKLHYQACDTAACFPPRDLPVAVAITAR